MPIQVKSQIAKLYACLSQGEVKAHGREASTGLTHLLKQTVLLKDVQGC